MRGRTLTPEHRERIRQGQRRARLRAKVGDQIVDGEGRVQTLKQVPLVLDEGSSRRLLVSVRIPLRGSDGAIVATRVDGREIEIPGLQDGTAEVSWPVRLPDGNTRHATFTLDLSERYADELEVQTAPVELPA